MTMKNTKTNQTLSPLTVGSVLEDDKFCLFDMAASDDASDKGRDAEEPSSDCDDGEDCDSWINGNVHMRLVRHRELHILAAKLGVPVKYLTDRALETFIRQVNKMSDEKRVLLSKKLNNVRKEELKNIRKNRSKKVRR